MRKICVLLCFVIVHSISAKKIVGSITNEKGEPLIGVVIYKKNDDKGVFSDVNGKYEIRAKKKNSLIYEFKGFETKEIKVGGKKVIDIVLQSEKIKSETFRTHTNQISEFSKDKSKQPVMIVDGLVVSDVSLLNPNAIESIQVLKDSALSGIYCIKPRNDVILITTKKKPTLDLNRIISGKVIDENGDPLPGVSIVRKGTSHGVISDYDGNYEIVAKKGNTLVFSYVGYKTKEITVEKTKTLTVQLESDANSLEEIVVIGYCAVKKKEVVGAVSAVKSSQLSKNTSVSLGRVLQGQLAGVNTASGNKSNIIIRGLSSVSQNKSILYESEMDDESYVSVSENGFKSAIKTPLSTFSIDVDAASYSNIRRFIMNGRKPPKDAVRVEEMINYFDYEYKEPTNEHPFSINYEVSDSPWNSNNKLVHIGLQGKHLKIEKVPASNLVFLIDVSGSMGSPNKLPLLKKAYALLVNQLREQDRVAIVVYAGSSGLVLPSTPGNEKEKILQALNNLQSGGSTAGAAGLKLAYKVAEENFIKKGNNRIILATDGDFNVGQSSDYDLEKLIKSKRDKGIFMSVTGFGMGNYKDSKMEIIADKGNGNYSYIDNLLEAKKVFINEFSSTLFTIAKDVKIQIEFNPKHVKEYRLIGYENRLLQDEDFDNDKKDAGELGAGHTVTALYEIVPVDGKNDANSGLKYQSTKIANSSQLEKELATVKFRYKQPDSEKSTLLVKEILNTSIAFEETSNNFQFSSAVAGFGMLLSHSEYKGNLSYKKILKMAKLGKGADEKGYRSEFIRLVELAKHL